MEFPNLLEKINLAKTSATSTGCCWQSASGWCLQVLFLPSPTCSIWSDLAVTQNEAKPHISEKAQGRTYRLEGEGPEEKGGWCQFPASAMTSAARWCWKTGARPAPLLTKAARSTLTLKHTCMGSNASSGMVCFHSSQRTRAFYSFANTQQDA